MERAERRRRPEQAEHKRPGPPSQYDPKRMPVTAKFMCQRGATMGELAAAFQVSTVTLAKWCNMHQELRDAVQVGVDTFNPRVERALAERAIGFWVTMREEVRDEDGKLLAPAQRQYFPPDTTACIFFLKNRMRDKYKDVHRLDVTTALKTSDDLRIEIHKDILELKAQGYDPKIIDGEVLQLPAPKKSNGHG
jgi:hypothetical protein